MLFQNQDRFLLNLLLSLENGKKGRKDMQILWLKVACVVNLKLIVKD